MKRLLIALLLMFSFTGCIDEWFGDDEGGSVNDLDGVDRFLGPDVSSWPVTVNLRNVYLNGSQIVLDHDESFGDWPATTVSVPVNANAWIIVDQGGEQIAATWEWLRPNQKVKNKSSVNGDHIKVSPLNTFTPQPGEVYYFFISGLARAGKRNVQERSNVVSLEWR